MISSSCFRFKSGTVQFSAGYPTGSKSDSFSDVGLSKSIRRFGPQFKGVEVNETSPAY